MPDTEDTIIDIHKADLGHIFLKDNEKRLLRNKLKPTTDLKFDLKKSIERLLKTKNGDLSSYYLSIIGFIEGFLRDTYHIDFHKTKFRLLSKDNRILKEKETPSVTLMLNALLHDEDTYFSYPENDIPMNIKKKNTAYLKYMCSSPNNEYTSCVDGNRIRHCFAEESIGGLAELVVQFVKFSKVFNFYSDNKKELDKLINDELLDSELRNFDSTRDIKKTINDNIKLSKSIQDFLVRNPEFASKFTTTQLQSLLNNSSLTEEQINFILNYNQLQDNQAILSYYSSSWRDYQSLLSKLTDEQKEIRDFVCDVFEGKIKDKNQAKHLAILGGPGTGKTILLINILQNFVSKNIQLLTYTNSLNKYNKYIASTINFSDLDLNDNVKDKLTSKIKTFDSYIIDKAEKILDQNIYFVDYQNDDFTDENSKRIIDYITQIDNKDTGLPPHEIYKEALKEIWGNMPKRDSYSKDSYKTGREITDKEKIEQRTKIWELIERVEKFLEDNKDNIEIPYEYACYKLANMEIPEDSKVDYLLIDEAQDLDNVRLNVISKLTRKNYVLAGDLAQSVFIEKGLSWNAFTNFVNNNLVKIHEIILKNNFRSTAPIQEVATSFLENENFKIKGIEPKVYSESYKLGPLPTYLISKNNEEAINAIKEQIIFLKKSRILSNRDFCIIASNEKELEQIHDVLGDELPSRNMEDKEFNFTNNDVIRLSTVKYVKGIDCSVVMLYLTKNYNFKKLNGGLDKNGQYNGIYASITRAMEFLEIFISNEGNYLYNDNIKNQNSVQTLIQVLKEKAINLSTLIKPHK